MANENAKKANNKATKKPVAARKSPSKFFKEMISELKKVSWPTRKELTTYTVAVVVVVLVFSVIIGIVDVGLTQLMGLIIR